AEEVVEPAHRPAGIDAVDACLDTAVRRVRRRCDRWAAAARDEVLVVGELASSRIIAAAVRSGGVPAQWLDPREIMRTDAAFGIARLDAPAAKALARRRLGPLIARGDVPVLGGFVGATAAGETTTLGRGGSDYSAAFLASALPADELLIWTDVDGVFTADPRVVSSSRRVDRLSFDEAFDLARFGAKVLHPASVEPLAANGIPARVLDPRRPDGHGTRINGADARRAGPVAGLAHQTGVAVADVRARHVGGSRRFLESALAWVEQHGRRATIVALSPHHALLASPDARSMREFASAVEDAGQVHLSEDEGLVAAVGRNVSSRSQVWRVVEGASGTLAHASSSGHAVVAITRARDTAGLVAHLHEELCVGAGA